MLSFLERLFNMDMMIVWELPSGKIAITNPNPDDVNKFIGQGMDLIAALDVIAAKAQSGCEPLANAKRLDNCERSNRPDLYWRDQWVADGQGFKIDMSSARKKRIDDLREIRDARLSDLDVEYMRKHEGNDEIGMKKISSLKNKLRDMPKNINLDKIKTPFELKDFIPSELTD